MQYIYIYTHNFTFYLTPHTQLLPEMLKIYFHTLHSASQGIPRLL